MSLLLPVDGGNSVDWSPSGATPPQPGPGGFDSRSAFAAVHVVADPRSDPEAGGSPVIDWDETLAYRHYLWSLGLGVAEAMDTAQRGAGVGWETARELILRTAAEAESVGGLAVYGASTDQLDTGGPVDLGTITAAYREQVEFVEAAGGVAILMASRELASVAIGPDDYMAVYDEVIAAASRPVMVHWLGGMFDPALAGYWGSPDPWQAKETLIRIVESNAGGVSGVKVSLLDSQLEVDMRKRLPVGVSVYTGDDLHYVDLILGDENGHSDALLGVFDPIAPVAAAALQALDRDDIDGYRALLEPTVPFARHLFDAPTDHYKTGVVFLAYLNDHQSHFRMVGGMETARSLPHLARLLVLADEAGLLRDPELATQRMRALLEFDSQ